jgi:hypothetical protein
MIFGKYGNAGAEHDIVTDHYGSPNLDKTVLCHTHIIADHQCFSKLADHSCAFDDCIPVNGYIVTHPYPIQGKGIDLYIIPYGDGSAGADAMRVFDPASPAYKKIAPAFFEEKPVVIAPEQAEQAT